MDWEKEDRPTCDFPIIDLNNACVLPGFVDAHMHPVMLADFSKEISTLPPKVNSIKDLIAEIKTKAQQLKKIIRMNGFWAGVMMKENSLKNVL